MNLTPSIKQRKIVEYIKKNNNVIVNSVAGSGKTTVNLFIGKEMKEKKILLLTYNSKLKEETRERVEKHEVENIEVHSFHSFCVKNYDSVCYTDCEINAIIKSKVEPKKEMWYDLIILDEVQDMKILYYELVCKICKDINNPSLQFCILGDYKQSIFQMNGSDERFILKARNLFNFYNKKWVECNLDKSFRITKEMSDFINNCVFHNTKYKIYSDKTTNVKPRYVFYDPFRPIQVYNEIEYYMLMGYKPNDIFILSPSLSVNSLSSQTPLKILENFLRKFLNIPIYIPISDEDKINEKISKNKLIFSTFHQSKGLERKVCIVLTFDDSYFDFYKKDCEREECPNELYVAITRGSECLTLFNNAQRKYLTFLKTEKLEDYCDIINKEIHNETIQTKFKPYRYSVTSLLKYLKEDVIQEFYEMLEINNIEEKFQESNLMKENDKEESKKEIVNVINENEMYEDVSDLNGIAIPAYLEYKLKGTMEMYKIVDTNSCCKFLKDKTGLDIKNVDINNLKINDILKISNFYNCYTKGFIHKIYQVKNYDWLTDEEVEFFYERMSNRLNITEKADFEIEVCFAGEKEMIQGRIDCLEESNIYEFKCVSSLKKEHFLQLAIYKYLYETEHKKQTNCFLYNILNDELFKLSCNNDKLDYMIKKIIDLKRNEEKRIYDKDFIKKMNDIRKNQFY